MKKDSQRLNKYLVLSGLANSRREADQAIAAGKVSINGVVITNLATQVIADDSVKRAGKVAKPQQRELTIIFNKPTGYICSHSKQGSAPTIFELLPKSFAQLKIAGRLDKDSEGLMILSSDGELIHRLSHPSFKKSKEYIVIIDKPLTEADSKTLLKGIELEDGRAAFDDLKKLSPSRLRVSLHQGKNRQIRRMLAKLGYTVHKLERVSMGPYALGQLKPGHYEFVTAEEAK